MAEFLTCDRQKNVTDKKNVTDFFWKLTNPPTNGYVINKKCDRLFWKQTNPPTNRQSAL